MDAFLSVVADWEWVLLLAVGILEFAILYKVRQEKRERDVLIAEMKSTRIELGRESYLAMIKETLGDAKRQVLFVSHSLTINMGQREREAIFGLYNESIDHRCITGRDPGKLREMWEQHRRGVEVRVSDLVMRSTFRYQVCDGAIVVLGFSKGGDDASRKGMLIDNVFFARVLQEHFLRAWKDSQPFSEYLREVINSDMSPELATSVGDLADEWKLPAEERISFEKLLAGPPQARHQAPNEPV